MGVDFKVVGFQCLRIQGLQKLRRVHVRTSWRVLTVFLLLLA